MMICDKIKLLREKSGMTQSALAKRLGITRSSVNAWEMGLSVPSTQYVVELSCIFNVSTDYILGIKSTSSIPVDGLTDKEIAALVELVECIKNKGK